MNKKSKRRTRLVLIMAVLVSRPALAALGPPVFRDRPAFSTEAAPVLLGYQKLDRSQVVNDAVKRCPKANHFVYSVFKNILMLPEAASFASSPFAPEVLVECEKRAGLTATDARGLLRVAGGDILAFRSEDELAFVLAHELSHITLAHFELVVAKRQKFRIDIGKELSGSDVEFEADENAIRWLAKTRYNPANGATLLKRQGAQERWKRVRALLSGAKLRLGSSTTSHELNESRLEVRHFLKHR